MVNLVQRLGIIIYQSKKKPLRILSGPKEEEKYVNPLQRVIFKRHI
jgi:hypothetical protein